MVRCQIKLTQTIIQHDFLPFGSHFHALHFELKNDVGIRVRNHGGGVGSELTEILPSI